MPMALKCFAEAFHSGALRVPRPAPALPPPAPTKARPRRANSPPPQRQNGQAHGRLALKCFGEAFHMRAKRFSANAAALPSLGSLTTLAQLATAFEAIGGRACRR